MIQQIKNTSTTKQLTVQDLKGIVYASCLNLFHTKTMFYPWPLGIYYLVNFHYVQRENNNKYNHCYYYVAIENRGEGLNAIGYHHESSKKTFAEIEEINSELLCEKDNEERLLIRCYYGSTKNTKPTKEKLGFLVISPTSYYANTFDTVKFKFQLVITPKPGLFPVIN